ncbi:ribonuclease P/MRP protein subunit POP5 [Anopheles ziemanni]|uniref:ribonuclease P/MRP protein subunit POP5 n=1 Tax=Anopheles coustani TaxID=139045 RepID=UPI002658887D|nr:ribonuclease P/MRP protein subunit POP5 [Anopheles coustani]XP_058167757.1 ribonuclease P/MRP protein subunit POP5 [Anopheles ziemanni]
MVRVKHRYILVQIKYDNRPKDDAPKVTSKSLSVYLRKQVSKYYGNYGAATVQRLLVMYFNAKTHLCIIRTRHGPHRFVTSVLPLLTQMDEHVFRFRTLYVGATVQQCQKFVVKYQQRYINRTIGYYQGMEQKQKMIENVTAMVRQ